MITNNKTLKESLDNYNGRFDDANEKLREKITIAINIRVSETNNHIKTQVIRDTL